MGDSPQPPRWVRIFGADCREGDLLRIAGEQYRVVDRTYTPAWKFGFRITLPDGSTMGLGKTSMIEVFDPDGSVAERVMEIPAR